MLGVLAAGLAGFVFALVFIYSGVYDIAASSGHYAPTAWVLDTVKVQSIRRHAPSAVALEGASAEEGVSEYQEMCAVCHGAPGSPRGVIGQGLLPEPPEMPEVVEEFKPGEIYWVVMNGIKMTGMPAFGATSPEQELKNVVAFVVEKIRAMSPAEYDAALQSSEMDRNQ